MNYHKQNHTDLLPIINRVYDWSQNQNFRGYNKHDALNSPLLKLLLGWSKWPRIIGIQSIMRFPVNLRPLLAVQKSYNPKGLALFTQGLMDTYVASSNDSYLNSAKQLLQLLEDLRSKGNWSGACWGYQYPWQDAGFYAPSGHPNAVVTCFVCEAFLDAYQLTGEQRYLDTTISAINFLSKDLTVLVNTDDELCFAYTSLPMTMRVMDVSILIASVLARCSRLSGDTGFLDQAHRLTRYVINRQTDYGAWFYTDPPRDSHITHDNYHTGFILDALHRYMECTDNWHYMPQYKSGLEFYATQLFKADGAPKWMHDKDYPCDIHGSAQGIITFSRHFDDYPGLAEKILNWTLTNMYNGNGRFYYQKNRFVTKKFTLLRWCNAWMFRAMTTYHRAVHTKNQTGNNE